MSKFICLICSVIFFIAGCKEKENAQSAAPAIADRRNASQSEAASSEGKTVQYSYQPSVETIPTPEGKAPLIEPSTIEPRIGEVLVVLTMHLRQYMEQKGKAPESVTELIASKMDSAPQAPKGTMYVIDARNKEVRLVKIK